MKVRNSQHAYREILDGMVRRETRWLDLGCGHQLLPAWMRDSEKIQHELVARCALVVGVDVDLRPHMAGIAKVCGNIEQLPFADDSFSLVTANMVIEHVKDPGKLLREIRRVLRPNGIFLFHTPNALYFEFVMARALPRRLRSQIAHLLDGRACQDIFPTFYRLNSGKQVKRLSRANGLNVETIQFVQTSPQFAALGKVVLNLELAAIRLVSQPRFAEWRSNLIIALSKASPD
jgi:ubiquinone/menaquinone biosynthesis C-methylase UbiE